MSRMILVPIDISDKEFTERIISHVESEARMTTPRCISSP